MEDIRLIDEIIPAIGECRGVVQGGYHHLPVWQHSLETLKQFELLYQRKLCQWPEVRAYLSFQWARGRSRLVPLKLSCLLHDIGKPIAKKKTDKKTIFHTHEKIGRDRVDGIARSLRLSLREREFIKHLVFWHLRPGYLADQITPSKRAIYRFFRDSGDDGVGIILLSLADWRATRGPLTDRVKRRRHEKIMFSLLEHFFKQREEKRIEKIVDGHDIMRRFSLTQGTLIGTLLERIKEEQAVGNVTTKKEADQVVARILTQQRTRTKTGKKKTKK